MTSPIAWILSLRLAAFITIVTILVGTASYFYTMALTEELVREKLQKYNHERGLRESALFLETEASQARFQKEYLERYRRMGDRDPKAWFDVNMEKHPEDGTYRSKSELYHGSDLELGRRDHSVSIYVGSETELTPEVRRALAIGYDMVNQHGPAWRKPFVDLYFASPEKTRVSYWPGTPLGLMMDDKVDWLAEEWMAITMKGKNPEREQKWSTILFDEHNRNGMVSGVTPLDIDGKQVGMVGTNLQLDDLIRRMTNEVLPGTYNILMQADGRVIMHPHMVEKIIASKGRLNAMSVEEGVLSRIFEHARSATYPAVIDSTENNQFLAVTRIEGPEWFFITVYPKSLLTAVALRTAGFTFLFSVIFQIVMVLIILLVLKRKLVGPLGRLTQIIRGFNIGGGLVPDQMDTFVSTVGEHNVHPDEIVLLSSSFNEMCANLRMTYSKLERSKRDLNQSNLDLSVSIAFLDTIISESPVGITIYDGAGECIEANKAIADMVGASKLQLLEQNFRTVKSWKESGLLEAANRALDENEIVRIEIDIDSTFGKQVFFDCQLVPFQNGDERNLMVMFSDISERKQGEVEQMRLQQELQQAQKMEALGQLTGGIAHDFNNIIGIIMGNSEMALSRYGDEIPEKMVNYLKTTMKASERAKDMVAQMLVFSRSGSEDSDPLQFAPLIKENVKMLHSILPSSIRIELSCEEDLPSILMHPTKMQQLMMNLCINARDAMGGIGTLTIGLKWHRDIDEKCSVCHKQVKGDWIELKVSDTGCGIDPESLNRIFDPFYTTKEIGKGTGMGLSVLHGIVSSHEGHVLVESDPGVGTTFRILFPPVAEEVPASDEFNRSSDLLLHGAGEDVLIVDDEPDLAEYIGDLLELHNYHATIKTDSLEALRMFQKDPDKFSLLITDQTMPGLTGVELVEQLREIRSDFPAILCTGYSDSINKDDAERRSICFLGKPIDADKLIQSAGELLGSTASKLI
ncbi:MAG: response regulator [Gammaproteobacteria bacterium]|nr:response regulator [Gammaproteobacteria bacterium]